LLVLGDADQRRHEGVEGVIRREDQFVEAVDIFTA
jgi:hypothetical protein